MFFKEFFKNVFSLKKRNWIGSVFAVLCLFHFFGATVWAQDTYYFTLNSATGVTTDPGDSFTTTAPSSSAYTPTNVTSTPLYFYTGALNCTYNAGPFDISLIMHQISGNTDLVNVELDVVSSSGALVSAVGNETLNVDTSCTAPTGDACNGLVTYTITNPSVLTLSSGQQLCVKITLESATPVTSYSFPSSTAFVPGSGWVSEFTTTLNSCDSPTVTPTPLPCGYSPSSVASGTNTLLWSNCYGTMYNQQSAATAPSNDSGNNPWYSPNYNTTFLGWNQAVIVPTPETGWAQPCSIAGSGSPSYWTSIVANQGFSTPTPPAYFSPCGGSFYYLNYFTIPTPQPGYSITSAMLTMAADDGNQNGEAVSVFLNGTPVPGASTVNYSTCTTFAVPLSDFNTTGNGNNVLAVYDSNGQGFYQGMVYQFLFAQTGPTCTPTNTFTNTPTNLSTNTSTNTCTQTATYTPTRTATATSSNTPTITSTYTPTASSSSTSSNTPTNTVMNISSNTATNTSTNTATNTPLVSSTWTNTLTNTSTNVSTNTLTNTITNTETYTVTNTFTTTSTNTAANTPTVTSTNTATNTSLMTSTSTNTATVIPTSTPVFTMTSTPTATVNVLVPGGNYTAYINVYNSAGEVVKQILVMTYSQPINSIVLQSGNTITTLQGPGSTVEIYYGSVLLGTWNGSNNIGNPASNGVYEIKVDSIGPTGAVTSVSQTVTINRQLSIVTADIFNEAGEVVRHLYSMVSDETNMEITNVNLSANILQLGEASPASPLPSVQIYVMTTGSPVTLSWDAVNDTGNIVTPGQYEIEVLWNSGDGATNIIRSILVVGEMNSGMVVARPNVLTQGSMMTTFDGTGVPNVSAVKVSIYTVAGELVKNFSDFSGTGFITWDASSVASGIYICPVQVLDSNGDVLKRQILKVLVMH